MACEADVRSEDVEVIERRLGGRRKAGENGVLAKKSTVKEHDDEDTTRGVTVGLGTGKVARRMGLRRRPRFWIQVCVE